MPFSFELNFETTNPYQDEARIECLCCYKCFVPNIIFKDKIKVEILSDLFSTFCNYMKWNSPEELKFDFSNEHFPVCSSCSNNLVRVFKLDEQIQNIISDVISTIFDGKNQISKKAGEEPGDGASVKLEFYRRQTIAQYQPTDVPTPVECAEPPVSGKEFCRDYPEQYTTPEGNVLVPTTPSRSSSRRSAGKKTWFPDQVQRLGESKFIYDNKYLFTSSLNHWQCLGCDKSYSTKFDLLLHWETVSCFSSEQPIEIIEAFPTHDETVPESSREQDSNVFKRDDMPNKKLESQQNPQKEFQRIFVCTQCGVLFKRKDTLQKHILSFHTDESSKIFCCQFCSRRFAAYSLLRDHLQRNHRNLPNEDVRSFACSMCAASFKRKDGLQRHILNLHTDESCKTFACQICSRKFATKSLLKEHVDGHRDTPCPICGETYPLNSMYRHKKKQHPTVSSSTATRVELEKKYKLLVHQNSMPESGVTSEHMKRCRAGAVTSENSGRNQNKSLSVNPKIACQLCSKVFRSKNCLHVHVVTFHTPDKDKAFQCRVCGKKFGLRSLLKYHFRIHEKVECDICNEIYAVNSIYSHKYFRHKSVECTVCYKHFKVDSIKEHIKLHKEQDPKARTPASRHPQGSGFAVRRRRKSIRKDGDSKI